MATPSTTATPTPADDDSLATVLLEIGVLARRFARDVVLPEDIEDVAQDVVLESLIKLRNGYWVADAKRVRKLVRRVVERRGVDVLRRAQRRREREAEHQREVNESVRPWMQPDVCSEEHELHELHERALAALPPACRNAYVMVREEGVPYGEAAVRLGLTRDGVKSHVKRAQRRLLNHLREHGVETPRRARNGALCTGSTTVRRNAASGRS